jgi:hypothetical protein
MTGMVGQHQRNLQSDIGLHIIASVNGTYSLLCLST